MIKSMTGFASVSHEDEAGVVGVTVRAVNHRYLDVQLRLPRRSTTGRAHFAPSFRSAWRADASR